MVTVKRLPGAGNSLQDPLGAIWEAAPRETFALSPTPLASQPSLYIQAKWAAQPYAAVTQVAVQAAHDDQSIFFRLIWKDDTEDSVIDDTDRFTDAAAVLFPVRDDAPLTSMGTPGQPVNAWYWRTDLPEPFSVTAGGVGTSVRQTGGGVGASGVHSDGAWLLVIWRAFGDAGTGAVRLTPGMKKKVAFGVWQGSNQERGGLKAVTLEWQPLDIEA